MDKWERTDWVLGVAGALGAVLFFIGAATPDPDGGRVIAGGGLFLILGVCLVSRYDPWLEGIRNFCGPVLLVIATFLLVAFLVIWGAIEKGVEFVQGGRR